MQKIKIIGVLIGGILLFLSLRGIILGTEDNFIKNSTSYVISPIGRTFSGAGWWVKDKFNFLTSIGELKNNNQGLFDENLRLKAQIAKSSEVEKENITLRKEMSLALREMYLLEMAMVIGRESGSYSEVVHIDKGSEMGVKKGMAALIGKGILVGRVIDSAKKTAKIQLITDKTFKVNAKLVESDGHGVIFGQYGTSVRMKMIPQTIKINIGDTVVTSELSDNFKSGLLIGYVQEVFSTADGLFQEVVITLPKELENLRLVQILKD